MALKRYFILVVGIVVLAGVTLWCYSVAQPIAFDEMRWKQPSWGWDRWRMVEDLQARLEETKLSYDETIQMLDGASERAAHLSGSRAEDASGRRILRYQLGKPFPLIGRGGDRTLLIGFDENGRVRGSEVREEDD